MNSTVVGIGYAGMIGDGLRCLFNRAIPAQSSYLAVDFAGRLAPYRGRLRPEEASQ